MTTEEMIQQMAKYFETQPVLKVWLFGSFARGEEREDSDVDLLVVYDRKQPIGLLKISGMRLALCDMIGRDVDLVEDGTLRPYAVPTVYHDRRLIYERA